MSVLEFDSHRTKSLLSSYLSMFTLFLRFITVAAVDGAGARKRRAEIGKALAKRNRGEQ